MKTRALTVSVVFAFAGAACQPAGEDRPHVSLGADAEALKAAFNADSGKVRVVMLVAPT